MHLRALAPLAFFGVSLLAGSAGAQLRGPVGPIKVTPPQAARAIGWAHNMMSGTSTDCGRSPGPNEVIVTSGEGFGGKCAALQPGFYPYSSNFLVGDDAIRSVKVGSNARLRAFMDRGYGGAWNIYAPNTQLSGLGPFNAQISSLRVEPGNRHSTCDDVAEGEIALYEGWDETGDCVVLPGDGAYATADAMGIANDTISSVVNKSGKTVRGFMNAQFNQWILEVKPHTKQDRLGQGSTGVTGSTQGADNSLSSLQML